MATKKTAPVVEDGVNPFLNPAREIQQNTLEREIETSFLPYAVSTIIDRAIPSAQDGTIPVQRRIMWTMFEEGYSPDRMHVKSAKVVGAVIGNYHPHGDSACYGSMVRLAQSFSLEVPLVDGHGNFGNKPGGEAAAARYTEARLSKEAMLLLEELREDVVDFVPSYDNTRRQPTVLPVKFPNLLVNGSSGIAVGFATNMPTHNPGEVIDAARHLLAHPDADLERLMKFVPGPDFPTGGMIIGQDAIKDAYTTGRGIIRMRGTHTVEPLGRGRSKIIFTELPYGVSSEKIIEKTKEAIEGGKLQGLQEIKNLSDGRVGTKLIFETKVGINPEALAAELFRFTPLEESFGINNVALVDETPKLLGLKDMLQIFIDHRIDVVTRRTQFRRDKAADALHQQEARKSALLNIDEVIRIVRTSDNDTVAQESLMKKLKLDETQADYILGISLRSLTKSDQIALEKRIAALEAEIAELDLLLKNPDQLRKLIDTELGATKKVIDRPRRSVLVGGNLAEVLAESKAAAEAASVQVEDGPTQVVVFADGTVKRVDGADTVRTTRLSAKVNPVVASIASTVRGRSILITDKGRGYRVENLTVGDKAVAGAALTPMPKTEKVIAVAPDTAAGDKAKTGLFFATQKGVVKLVNPDYPVRGEDFDLIGIDAGDSIVAAAWVADVTDGDIVFISSDASLLRFESAKVRPQGRTGGGVAGINLAADARVLAAAFVPKGVEAQVYTHTGASHKMSPLSQAPYKGRATGGVRYQAMLKGETGLVFAAVGPKLVLADSTGKSVVLPGESAKRDASGAKIDQVPVLAGS